MQAGMIRCDRLAAEWIYRDGAEIPGSLDRLAGHSVAQPILGRKCETLMICHISVRYVPLGNPPSYLNGEQVVRIEFAARRDGRRWRLIPVDFSPVLESGLLAVDSVQVMAGDWMLPESPGTPSNPPA